MFKKLIFGLSLFVTLGFGATFDDALEALNKKEYKLAFSIFEDISSEIEELANKGNDKAQYNIGYMYHRGFGVKQNYERAVYYYEKAASNGNADAQSMLGDRWMKAKMIVDNNLFVIQNLSLIRDPS